MATSQVDMSLDDIIKQQRKKGANRGRGGFQRGRGGNQRGGGGFQRGRGGFRGRGQGRSSGVRGGRVVKPGQKFTRPSGLRAFRRGTGFQSRGRAGFTQGKFGKKPIGANSGTSKLSISNLDFGVNDNDIKELFREFGVMTKATVNYDSSGRPLGTAEVVYSSATSAKAAAAHYNNVPLDGRPMRIQVYGGNVPTTFKRNRLQVYNKFKRTGGNLRGGFRRGAGRGFNRSGRGGRGRGKGGRSAPPSKEDLDKQLEQYNASV